MTAGSTWTSGGSWVCSLAKRAGAANTRTNSSTAFRFYNDVELMRNESIGFCLVAGFDKRLQFATV